MFQSLLNRARLLPADLQRRLRFYWYARDIKDLFLVSLIGLPVVMLGFLLHFAYTDHIRIDSERHRHTDLTCLAGNIYFEARGEPIAGQYAVAEVTMNRVASTRFPSTVCGVVHEKRWDANRMRYVGAFSWTELDAIAWPKGVEWRQAMVVAIAVYDQQAAPKVHGALFYHASNIAPRWSKTKKKVAEIGGHKFYL